MFFLAYGQCDCHYIFYHKSKHALEFEINLLLIYYRSYSSHLCGWDTDRDVQSNFWSRRHKRIETRTRIRHQFTTDLLPWLFFALPATQASAIKLLNSTCTTNESKLALVNLPLIYYLCFLSSISSTQEDMCNWIFEPSSHHKRIKHALEFVINLLLIYQRGFASYFQPPGLAYTYITSIIRKWENRLSHYHTTTLPVTGFPIKFQRSSTHERNYIFTSKYSYLLNKFGNWLNAIGEIKLVFTLCKATEKSIKFSQSTNQTYRYYNTHGKIT